MDSVILDTDVLSFIAKDDTRANLYSPLLPEKRLCICFQTVAELKLWMTIRSWGSARRNALDLLLNQFVVLPYDPMMAEHWALLTAHRRQLGQPIECGDAWIAASAIRHETTLLSHYAKHYENIPGLNLVSFG